jgi:hypothetical protein
MNLELEAKVGQSEPLIVGTREINLEEILNDPDSPGELNWSEGGNDYSIRVTPSQVVIDQRNGPSFKAEVLEDPMKGVNYLKVKMVTKDLATNSHIQGYPRGRELVRNALSFLNNHQAITEFRAIWRVFSDNSDAFEKSKSRGMTDEAAAFSTWSGKNIARPYFPYLTGKPLFKDRAVHVTFTREKTEPQE